MLDRIRRNPAGFVGVLSGLSAAGIALAQELWTINQSLSNALNVAIFAVVSVFMFFVAGTTTSNQSLVDAQYAFTDSTDTTNVSKTVQKRVGDG